MFVAFAHRRLQLCENIYMHDYVDDRICGITSTVRTNGPRHDNYYFGYGVWQSERENRKSKKNIESQPENICWRVFFLVRVAFVCLRRGQDDGWGRQAVL